MFHNSFTMSALLLGMENPADTYVLFLPWMIFHGPTIQGSADFFTKDMAVLGNLAIRPKLLAAFGSLLILTIILGVLALGQIRTIHRTTLEICNVWLPSVDALGDVKAWTARQRIAAQRVVVASDDAQRAEAIRLYGVQTEALEAALKQYEAIDLPEEERTFYAQYQALRGPYEQSMQDDFVLAAQQHAAAAAAMNGPIVKVFRQVQDAIETLSKHHRARATEAAEVAKDAYTTAIWSIGGTALVAVLLSIAAVLWLDRDLAQRLAGLTGIMRRLAVKDYGFAVQDSRRRDEVGDMARAIEVFRTSMQQGDALAAAQAGEAQAKAERANRIDRLVKDFDQGASTALQAVAAASGGLHDTAQSLAQAAETGAKEAIAVAGSSQQTASNVETVAAAAEELQSSIREISRQVATSSGVAAQAVTETGRTNETVQTLTETADRIGAVVSLISSIASQTNLLALNATIEAARAGDAGKGFAVVASEVKALASQTEKATGEIRDQIEAMQMATSATAGAIASIARTIGEIDQITGAIAAAVEEQGAAAQEIARNIQEAARGTSEVSAGISGVSRAASETGSAAGQVLAAADTLSHHADSLKSKVGTFLGALSAA
jgi:methyl-accepting chemotaxis protein